MTRLACAAALLLGACSGFIDDKAASSTLKILKSSSVAGLRQPDVQLAHDALPGGIIQLEAFAIAFPKRPEFRELHAMALCQYTTAFIMDDWDEAKLRGNTVEADKLEARLPNLLAACIDAQLSTLPPAWRAAHDAGNDQMIAYLPKVTKAQARALVSISSAEVSFVAMAPFAHLGDLPRIRAQLERSIALAPGLDDARAELTLGSIAAGQAAFLGGDDGAKYFEAARKLAGPQHFLTEVLYARGVAVAHGDRARFEATLRAVIAADATKWPEHRLPNELAKRKARRYLDAEDALLPLPAPDAGAGSGSGSASSN